jgi:hypothetical protein
MVARLAPTYFGINCHPHGAFLVTLPEDGNVVPKHVEDTIHNKLNELLVYLLIFHAYLYWGF